MAVIEIDNLSFTYAGKQEPALKNISLRAQAGECVAVVGCGGSGKSTLLRACAGFLPRLVKGCREGRVDVAGVDPGFCSTAERVARTGLLFSEPTSQLSGICSSVQEEIAWGLGNISVSREEMEKRVEEMMLRLRLQDVRRRNPFALSDGLQQRVALASVLVLAPMAVFLDEPVAALDPLGRQEVLKVALDLAASGKVVFWSTSQLVEAQAFPRWLVMHHGEVVYDGPAKIPDLPDNGPWEAPWTRIERQLLGKAASDRLSVREVDFIRNYRAKQA